LSSWCTEKNACLRLTTKKAPKKKSSKRGGGRGRKAGFINNEGDASNWLREGKDYERKTAWDIAPDGKKLSALLSKERLKRTEKAAKGRRG